jgi:hypothetical protein
VAKQSRNQSNWTEPPPQGRLIFLPPSFMPQNAILEQALKNAMIAQAYPHTPVAGRPKGKIVLQEKAPETPEFRHLFEFVKLTLDDEGQGDIMLARPQEILKGLCRGRLKAYKRQYPVEILENTLLNGSHYNLHIPARNIKDRDDPIVYWQNSIKQVYVLGHTPDLFEPQEMEPGKASYLCLRAGHVNDCKCPALTISNNLPSNVYVLVCKPDGLILPYGYKTDTRYKTRYLLSRTTSRRH